MSKHPDGITRRDVLRGGMLAGLGLAAIPIAGCGSSSTHSSAASATGRAAAQSGTTVTELSHYVPDVEAFAAMNRAFQTAMQELHGAAKLVSYPGTIDTALSQVQTFPQLGIQGVHSFLVEDSPVTQYAKVLTDAKVAYQNLSNRLPWFAPNSPDYNGYFIGTEGGSFAEEGYVMGKLLFERAGGTGDAIVLDGVQGGLSTVARDFGIQAAMKEYPNIKVVARAYTNFDTATAQQAMAQLLPSHPNVKMVISLNDGVSDGALASMRAVGNHTTLINGFDGDSAFLQNMIIDPRCVCTSAGLIGFSGLLGAVRLFDFAKGVRFSPVETFINTDSIIIDTPAAAKELLKITGPQAPVPWSASKMSRFVSGDKWQIPHKIVVVDPSESDWGSNPGANHMPKPSSFAWPASYEAAINAGEIDKVNADWAGRLHDPYGPVRAAAKYKFGAIGTWSNGRFALQS